MGNQELLFASLVGSNVIKTVPRLKLVENNLQKQVLGGFPLNMESHTESINQPKHPVFGNLWEADKPLSIEEQFFPLSLSIDEGTTYFTLPYEPLISISGKNNIIRRNVAKWNAEGSETLTGSIKERWSQDDYEITITGVLVGALTKGNVADCFPIQDFQKLKQLLTYAKEIRVQCPPLELLDISKIVVETFSFPFTKGVNVQAYDIKAYSDSSYNLLIDL